MSIHSLPLLGCLALSVAVHAAVLCSRGLYRPPAPQLQTGRTVLQLTLAPSAASRAAAPAELSPAAVPLTGSEHRAAPSIPAETPRPSAESETAKPAPAEGEALIDAAEQDASLTEDKGVTAEAVAASAIRPVYPRLSRRRGEEGTVTLSVDVTASGRADRVEIIRSSGHPRLDQAACRAVRDASFTPAQHLGRAVDSSVELSFTFTLTDD
jgi:protein TonB